VTTSTLDPELDAPPPQPARRRRPAWWKEALFVLVFYAGYTAIRDIRGSRPVSKLQAFTNADRLIDIERFFGIFQEQRIQHPFLSYRLFVSFWDVFYGTAHFAVTAMALVWLFHRQQERYPLWRNTLAITTALALIGFAFFPLMPPRLLPAHYHFVDTLKTIGGLWSFDSGEMVRVSNQYAAMPSLHFAWSSWSALVLGPAIKPRWGKALIYGYPLATLFCIVVTGNHYILDAAGGALVLGAGYLIARALTRAKTGSLATSINPALPG
jgi:PAP2 superfamily